MTRPAMKLIISEGSTKKIKTPMSAAIKSWRDYGIDTYSNSEHLKLYASYFVDCLHLADGTDRLYPNIGKELPL